MQFPRHTHPLHYIEEDGGSLLVADLAECRLLEINPCVRDILDMAPAAESQEAVIAALSDTYDAEDIAESLEALEEIGEQGLLFATDDEAAYPLFDKQRPRYYIPQERELWYSDIKNMSAGTNISLYYQAKALSQHVDLHFAGTKFEKIDEGIYEVPLPLGDVIGRPWKFEQYDYDAVLFLHMPARNDYLPLYRTVDVPIIMQNHGPRGHGGEATNSLLLHYSIMRDYDAITAPSDYVREYMSEFVLQPEMFRTLPNGVDHDLFQPMVKDEAKRIVAELSGRPEVMDRPTVGFLSRIQPEKGATVFFRIAERIPEAVFIVTGKGIERYEDNLPENVVYVPFQPRDMLPVVYNAFDVYCFPAMSGEETFGMTLLEAMACGVPPVVTDFDGLPSVAGDAGIIVPAHNLARDMGSFASFAPPDAMAEHVLWLIEHEEERVALGEKAHQRAQTFTWDITAQHVVKMARECRETQRLTRRGDLTVRFTTAMDWTDGEVRTQALLLNVNEHRESATQMPRYPLRVDEGIALSLLRDHTAREVEAVLKGLADDPGRAGPRVKRVAGFLDQMPL